MSRGSPSIVGPAGVLLSLVLLPAGAGLAQSLGTEFQVNSYTTYAQSRPSVAVGGAGEFLVVWQSYGQDASGYGIFGRRFQDDGTPLGDEFQISAVTTRSEIHPAVAADGSGGFVVVWEAVAPYGLFRELRGRRLAPDGSPAGGDFPIATATTTAPQLPAIAASPTGEFVVAWTRSEGILARRFDAAGNPLGGEFQVETYTTGRQSHAAVAVGTAGDFVVVWQSWGADGSAYGIAGRRFVASGEPQGGEFQVNTYTADYQFEPAVAIDPGGGFVVAWAGIGDSASFLQVFARRYEATGDPVGGEFQVSRHAGAHQRDPAVTVHASGEFLVTWTGALEVGSYQEVSARLYDAGGRSVLGPFQVNSYTTAYQNAPVATALGSGDFVLSWQDQAQDGSFWSVIGRVVHDPLFADGFEAGDVCAWSGVAGAPSCP